MHPHTNHTCLYSSAAQHHRPLAGTSGDLLFLQLFLIERCNTLLKVLLVLLIIVTFDVMLGYLLVFERMLNICVSYLYLAVNSAVQ